MGAFLTPRQVAEQLAVSQRTVYAWIEQGRLPAVRFSERTTRIPREAVEALIAEATSASGGSERWVAAESVAAYGAGGVGGVTFCMRCGADVDPLDTRSPTERLRAVVDANRETILALAERNRLTNVRLFGSVARGDARPGSDIDFLVDVAPLGRALDAEGFRLDLEDLLGFKVDVTVAAEVKARSRDRILSEAVPL